MMTTRREFLRAAAAATAEVVFAARGFSSGLFQAPQSDAARRRIVTVAGKRVKVIDIHAHCEFPEVAEVIKGTPLARYADSGRLFLGPKRIEQLDRLGNWQRRLWRLTTRVWRRGAQTIRIGLLL
jgi:hypothetical protein